MNANQQRNAERKARRADKEAQRNQYIQQLYLFDRRHALLRVLKAAVLSKMGIGY